MKHHSIFKVAKLPLAIVLSTLMLAACGDDDNDSYSSSNNGGDTSTETEDVIQFSFFDSRTENGLEGIERVTWVYEDGNRQLIKDDIVNQNNRQGLTNADLVALGASFESVMAKSNIDVEADENSINFEMTDSTDGQEEEVTIILHEVDLAGVSDADYDADNDSGIVTDMYYYDKLPDDLTYPEGSVCYISEVTSTIDLFTFDESDPDSHSSLEDWAEAYSENVYGDNIVQRTEESRVGSNNQYPALRLVYSESLIDSTSREAVMYNDVLYNAGFYKNGTVAENADVSQGLVDCGILNDTAADFLEEQLVTYYQ